MGLNCDALTDSYVILPTSVLPEPTEVAEIKDKGYTVFATFKKQDYPLLASHLPVPNALDADKFFIIKGPKSLPLFKDNTPYHGPADNDALALMTLNHSKVVSKIFFTINKYFNATSQAFLFKQSTTLPDAVFKKMESSRPTCQTFTTLVDGLSEDVKETAKAAIALVNTKIATFKTLPVIPCR